jgi:hypothetical protein
MGAITVKQLSAIRKLNHFGARKRYDGGMNTLTDWTLNNLAVYGPLTLVFIAYIGSLGIPFPITMVIVVA